jgi:alcohol dehydrogenase, propanol-preferring
MKAWVIDKICDLHKETSPLKLMEIPKPAPKEGELLIKVNACGVCHTEIDEIEGRAVPASFPMVPGHQVIGSIEHTLGKRTDLKMGDRVGVAWIYSACGKCEYCLSGRENLCYDFKGTGRDTFGGYADYIVVPEHFVYKIPDMFDDYEAAPLLCAGAIGYRSVSLGGIINGQSIGLTGFGASAHLVLKLLKYKYPLSDVLVFARSREERAFALELGCSWAGDTTDKPPRLLDCIIDTTPAWKPAVHALEILKPGGRLIINAIRKDNADRDYLQNLDYMKHMWMEKEIISVANITSQDVLELLKIAAEIPLKPEIEIYPFEKANQAILDIKNHRIRGAKVLML